MNTRAWTPIVVALAVVAVIALVAALAPQSAPTALAAPPAIPTPASVTRPASPGYITFNPFATSAITADTTSTCFDVGKQSTVDVLYTIDQGTTNTVTLTSQWSVDGTRLADGVNLVANNTADATDIAQLQVFGRYFCLLANVSNANTITITAQAIAK